MVKPDAGWLHDDRALNAGRGVFVQFTVTWTGSIELPSSIRGMGVEDQTTLAREAIACTVDASKSHSIKLKGGGYELGKVTAAGVKVQLLTSASGIVAAAHSDGSTTDDDLVELNYSAMNLISLAAGGEGKHYDHVVYIGKDKATGLRCAFVYDCGKVADQVLITIGQAFTLAQNQPKKVKHKKKRSTVNLKEGPAAAAAPGDPVVEERPHTVDLKTGTIKEVEVAFALPSIIETIAEEVEEQSKTADEIVNISNPEVAKMVTTKKGEVDDIGKELLAMMKAEVEVVIEAHEKAATLKKGAKMAPNKAASLKVSLAETANLTPAKLIARLNAAQSEKEDVSLRKATIRPQDRPTWIYFQPDRDRKKIDLAKLRKKQKDQAAAEAAGGD